MLAVNPKIKPETDSGDDPRLKTLLQQWRGIEPSPRFEAAVWRRIRSTAVETQPVTGLWSVARGWLRADPVWVPLTAAAGLLLGVSLALSLPPAHSGPTFAAPPVHSRTLAGAYLEMASGGIR